MKVFKKKGGFFQMKKIIGILLAGALVTSAFAADVNAQVKMKGSLANWNGSDFKALSMGTDNGADYNHLLKFSANLDKAGTEVAFWINDDSAVVTDHSLFKIWVQPIDILKLTFGCVDFNLNQETIDWYRSNSDAGKSFGYSAQLSVSGFVLDLMLANAYNKPWFDGEGISRTAVKAQYGADFGTISALLTANDTFKSIKFGAGYNNTFGSVNMFVNALGWVGEDGFEKAKVELFGKGNVDAFSWAAFVPVEIAVGDDVVVTPGLVAKLSYQLSACGVDLYIAKGNLTKWPEDALTVRPGVRFNIGSASMEVQAAMNITDKVTLDVPIMCNLSW